MHFVSLCYFHVSGVEGVALTSRHGSRLKERSSQRRRSVTRPPASPGQPVLLPYITRERFLPSIARLRMCIIHSTVARTRWRKVFDARIYCARGWLIARNAVREISMTMNKYRATVQSCASSIKLEYTHEDVRFFRNFLRKYISSFKILTILFYFFEEEEDDCWYHSRNHYSVDIDLKKASNNRKEGFFLE